MPIIVYLASFRHFVFNAFNKKVVHYSIQWSSVAEMSEYDDVISPAAVIMRRAKANLTVILKSSVTASLPISLHFHKLKAAPFCPAHHTAVVHRVETLRNAISPLTSLMLVVQTLR